VPIRRRAAAGNGAADDGRYDPEEEREYFGLDCQIARKDVSMEPDTFKQ
jgi:hypothetical protein